MKIVLLILKGSEEGKSSIDTGIDKLTILTVCCSSQVPKGNGRVQHFFFIYMLGLLKDSWPNILMCLFNLNPGDITGDFKFVCSSTEDILLHITTQPYCHFVFSLQQINFHFTSLSENIFLVAFLILRMLHCVCGHYELRLLAFDVLWKTIPDLHGRRVSLVTN